MLNVIFQAFCVLILMIMDYKITLKYSNIEVFLKIPSAVEISQYKNFNVRKKKSLYSIFLHALVYSYIFSIFLKFWP